MAKAPVRSEHRYEKMRRSSEPYMLLSHLTSILGSLPPTLNELSSEAQRTVVGKNEIMLSEGERWEHLWGVERGCLRLYYLDRQGRSSNKNFYLEGALFWPITPALADEPVGFWVEAIEESLVWAIPWRRWQSAAENVPAWNVLKSWRISCKTKCGANNSSCSVPLPRDISGCSIHIQFGWNASRCTTWLRI